MENEVKTIWNANADFWDKKMGEGNDFHKVLIEPNQLELLNIKKGDRILDIACGNGQFARKMAEQGASVTAIDLSDDFIRIAKSKSKTGNIDYRVVDAGNPDQMCQLKGLSFDSAVCTMAIMDIEYIEPMLSSLPSILKHGGVFLFSILHPCFNSGENTLVHEHNDIGGTLNDKYSVKISNYLISGKLKGVGMRGQPMPQYYFHRPLSELLTLCFKNNFVMDAIREPSFKDIEGKNTWENVFKNIPPAIICRFRKL